MSGVELAAHTALVYGLAAVAGGAVSWWVSRRDGVGLRAMVMPVLVVALAAVIGAKVFSFVERGEWAWWSPAAWRVGELFQGFRHPGALAGGVVGVAIVTAIRRDAAIADRAAPGLCIGLAVVRVNCMLEGCCLGQRCTSTWCTLLGGDRYPLALLFLLWSAAVGALLLWLVPRRAFTGEVGLVYLALHEAGKAALETLRFPPVPILVHGSLAIAAVAATVLAAVGGARLLRRRPALPASVALLLVLGRLAAAQPVEVTAPDRVSVRFDGVPAADALASVAAAVGAAAVGTPPAGSVYLAARDAPLVEVLERLLGDRGFAVTYGPDGRPRRIEVHGAATVQTVVPGAPRPPPASPGMHVPAGVLGIRARAARDGALFRLVGPRDLTLGELIRLALQHDDARVRRDAARTALGAVMRVPDARAWARATLEAAARSAGPTTATDRRIREALADVARSADPGLASRAGVLVPEADRGDDQSE